MLTRIALMSLALAGSSADREAMTFDEWRASGARPVVLSILENGTLDEIEKAALRSLVDREG